MELARKLLGKQPKGFHVERFLSFLSRLKFHGEAADYSVLSDWKEQARFLADGAGGGGGGGKESDRPVVTLCSEFLIMAICYKWLLP